LAPQRSLQAALARFKAEPVARGPWAAKTRWKRFADSLDYRWREMLRLVGMEPTSRLTQRAKPLNQLAAMAESEQGR
jgi:hypothetical protein